MFRRRPETTVLRLEDSVVQVPDQVLQQFEVDGYAVARDPFTTDEVDFYIDHCTRLREAGSYAGAGSRLCRERRWRALWCLVGR